MVLWNGILVITGVIVLVTLVGSIIFARSRRGTGSRAPLISLTLFLAAATAGISLLGAILTFVRAFTPGIVTMTVPVLSYWPLPLPGVHIQEAKTKVIGGGFTQAELSVEGLSSGARLFSASGLALGALTTAAIAALVALVCFQLLRGAPFTVVVARAAAITAAVVLVGGIGSQVLSQIGGSLASSEIFAFSSASVADYAENWDLMTLLPRPENGWSIDLVPVGAALGLLALAAVFRHGTKLERDTAGLV